MNSITIYSILLAILVIIAIFYVYKFTHRTKNPGKMEALSDSETIDILNLAKQQSSQPVGHAIHSIARSGSPHSLRNKAQTNTSNVERPLVQDDYSQFDPFTAIPSRKSRTRSAFEELNNATRSFDEIDPVVNRPQLEKSATSFVQEGYSFENTSHNYSTKIEAGQATNKRNTSYFDKDPSHDYIKYHEEKQKQHQAKTQSASQQKQQAVANQSVSWDNRYQGSANQLPQQSSNTGYRSGYMGNHSSVQGNNSPDTWQNTTNVAHQVNNQSYVSQDSNPQMIFTGGQQNMPQQPVQSANAYVNQSSGITGQAQQFASHQASQSLANLHLQGQVTNPYPTNAPYGVGQASRGNRNQGQANMANQQFAQQVTNQFNQLDQDNHQFATGSNQTNQFNPVVNKSNFNNGQMANGRPIANGQTGYAPQGQFANQTASHKAVPSYPSSQVYPATNPLAVGNAYSQSPSANYSQDPVVNNLTNKIEFQGLSLTPEEFAKLDHLLINNSSANGFTNNKVNNYQPKSANQAEFSQGIPQQTSYIQTNPYEQANTNSYVPQDVNLRQAGNSQEDLLDGYFDQVASQKESNSNREYSLQQERQMVAQQQADYGQVNFTTSNESIMGFNNRRAAPSMPVSDINSSAQTLKPSSPNVAYNQTMTQGGNGKVGTGAVANSAISRQNPATSNPRADNSAVIAQLMQQLPQAINQSKKSGQEIDLSSFPLEFRKIFEQALASSQFVHQAQENTNQVSHKIVQNKLLRNQESPVAQQAVATSPGNLATPTVAANGKTMSYIEPEEVDRAIIDLLRKNHPDNEYFIFRLVPTKPIPMNRGQLSNLLHQNFNDKLSFVSDKRLVCHRLIADESLLRLNFAYLFLDKGIFTEQNLAQPVRYLNFVIDRGFFKDTRKNEELLIILMSFMWRMIMFLGTNIYFRGRAIDQDYLANSSVSFRKLIEKIARESEEEQNNK